MSESLREYDAKVDTKKRVTLRNASYEYYHVYEMPSGRIILDPRELVAPFAISETTLKMMDEAVSAYKVGNISEPIDLKELDK